jgi:hypothetical protein
VLSVGAALSAQHTGHMATDTRATSFVTGAAEFIGSERVVVGPVLADHLQTDAVFSNIRPRGIGFRFRYPTLERGLQQILGTLRG